VKARTDALYLSVFLAAATCSGAVWVQFVGNTKPIGNRSNLAGTVTVLWTTAVVVHINLPASSEHVWLDDSVYIDDAIVTGSDGSAGLVFTDGDEGIRNTTLHVKSKTMVRDLIEERKSIGKRPSELLRYGAGGV